jgi:sugar phosphate isomerase/epimerase
MKFSFLTGSAPRSDLYSQCEAIALAGCEGIENLLLPGTYLEGWQKTVASTAHDHGLEIAAVIVGGLALYQPGQTSWLSEAFHAIKELGAGALVTPEYRSQDPLPLLPPYESAHQDEQACVDEAVQQMNQLASQLKLNVFFEPITAFQSRFWRDTETVLDICKSLNNPYIGLALDFWVMNITQRSITESILEAGSWVHHIHLADNNRLLPGFGHIDFASGIQALNQTGYQGWYSFECAVLGDFVPEVSAALKILREY